MKKRITNLTALCLLIAFGSTAQIQLPAPSPAGSVFSKVGLTDVTIEYSRPKVKGRKIFGEGSDYLQPYGQLWRAGANAGSKLILSTGANIGGTDVEAGEYLIFATPGADSWNVSLYSDISLGGNVGAYDKEKEVMNADVTPTKLSTPIETLTFNITDISEDNTTANIELAWADVSVKVPVKVEFDETVMKDIAAKTKVDPRNYVGAANYYFNAGKDLDQALEWMNMYLAVGDNSAQFWNVHTKAQILAKMGKTKEAIATAKESMEKAKNNEQGDFGYVKRNEDLIASLKK
jgi:tetratricopeptide (TPR) repeat protein